jgi:hypothetical protein
VLLSEQEWPTTERGRVVSKEKTEMSNNNMCLRCEKKGDPGWQSKETSPKTRVSSNWVASKGDASYKHASPI